MTRQFEETEVGTQSLIDGAHPVNQALRSDFRLFKLAGHAALSA